MADMVTINLNTLDGLGYVEHMADNAPTLVSRADHDDPLSDFWRDVIKKLIAQAKEAHRG